MNRIENLVDLDKLNELKVSELKKLNKLLGKEVEEKKERNVLVWVLAIIGAVAASLCRISFLLCTGLSGRLRG